MPVIDFQRDAQLLFVRLITITWLSTDVRMVVLVRWYRFKDENGNEDEI